MPVGVSYRGTGGRISAYDGQSHRYSGDWPGGSGGGCDEARAIAHHVGIGPGRREGERQCFGEVHRGGSRLGGIGLAARRHRYELVGSEAGGGGVQAGCRDGTG